MYNIYSYIYSYIHNIYLMIYILLLTLHIFILLVITQHPYLLHTYYFIYFNETATIYYIFFIFPNFT